MPRACVVFVFLLIFSCRCRPRAISCLGLEVLGQCRTGISRHGTGAARCVSRPEAQRMAQVSAWKAGTKLPRRRGGGIRRGGTQCGWRRPDGGGRASRTLAAAQRGARHGLEHGERRAARVLAWSAASCGGPLQAEEEGEGECGMAAADHVAQRGDILACRPRRTERTSSCRGGSLANDWKGPPRLELRPRNYKKQQFKGIFATKKEKMATSASQRSL